MRNFWIAALAVLSVGMIQAPSARADWREAISGAYANSPSYQAPAPQERVVTKGAKTAKSAKATKTAKGKRQGVVQQASFTSTGTWTKSLGSTSQTGIASYYWQPQRVASGGMFNPNAMTAAHRTLPFGTKVQVTNANNGRSVTVTINDRGPFVKGRIIDLSSAAAGVIGMKSAGIARVNVAVLGR